MQTEKNHAMNQSPATRYLIAGGAIGPLLFIIVFLIEGATRPGYNAWHHYVSSLSLSDQGWMQIANFLVCGLLTLCFAVGLQHPLDPEGLYFRQQPLAILAPQRRWDLIDIHCRSTPSVSLGDVVPYCTLVGGKIFRHRHG